jgi:CheY-like chemotaxis protein
MVKGRVLVADDEVILSNTLKKVLTEQGYKIAVCNKGEEFFRQLAEHKPDLVLLDIYLGELNGIQLLQRMRSEGWNLPVIIMTAHSDVSLAVQAMKEGAASHVSASSRRNWKSSAHAAASWAGVWPSIRFWRRPKSWPKAMTPPFCWKERAGRGRSWLHGSFTRRAPGPRSPL